MDFQAKDPMGNNLHLSHGHLLNRVLQLQPKGNSMKINDPAASSGVLDPRQLKSRLPKRPIWGGEAAFFSCIDMLLL